MEGSADRQSKVPLIVEEFVQHKSSVLKVDGTAWTATLCKVLVWNAILLLHDCSEKKMPNASFSSCQDKWLCQAPLVAQIRESTIYMKLDSSPCDLHVGSL